jgi:hypothetical protein
MKVEKIVMIVLLLLILYQVSFPRVSGYADLSLKGVKGDPSGLFGLKHQLKCTPSGFNKDSAYYSKDLTPGGLCGDMDFVRNQERGYIIDKSSGDSLLA